jgi:Fe-S-cluster-containing hydrogenase component 2
VKKQIVIDFEKCSGCRTCELICSITKKGIGNPSLSYIKVLKWTSKGIDIPDVCLQCEDPMCVDVCPVNALEKNSESGIVEVKDDICVGCKLCLYVCPIGAISIDPISGVASKCDLCNGDPMCVKYCPPEAIKFMNVDTISNNLKRSKAHKLLEIYQKEIG